MIVRRAQSSDHDALWAMLGPVFKASDTYTLDPDISRDDALGYWLQATHTTFVAEDQGAIVGTYYIRPNQGGGGAHVCNCGYVTDVSARGKGVARAMLEHSLDEARRQGFRAMQYNLVVSTNERAIKLWQVYGFEIVGRLPGAFHHPQDGYVDGLIMYQDLTNG